MGLVENIAREREERRGVMAAENFAKADFPSRVDGESVVAYCSSCDNNTSHYPIGVQEGIGMLYNCVRCDTTHVVGEVA